MNPDFAPYKPRVDIDLEAVCANYRMLARASAPARAAAVVKCNAYGLGLGPVARSLAIKERCEIFFVAYAETGAALRQALEGVAPDAKIYIFNGPAAQSLCLFDQHRLIPVLNSLTQATLWARARPGAPAALHIDTGMNRLGAEPTELDAIKNLDDLNISLVMSHLACGSEPQRSMNARQLETFNDAAANFPKAPKSLAASAGALMAPDFHCDLTRLGVGLYGVSPFDEPDERIRPVARLTAPVIQIRSAAKGETAGYSGKYPIDRPSKLATVALGYGDGFPRAGSNAAYAFIGGALCPVAGCISMDLITLDVTDAKEPVSFGDRAEFFGPNLTIEDAAKSCGTIGYELLTNLGARVNRRYCWADAPAEAILLGAPGS